MTWGLIQSLFPRRADWRDDISAYLDDELSPRDRARVESRLAESAEMQEYLVDLQDMRSVLRRFEPTQSSTPFQLTTEMIDDPARIRVQPAGTAKALRLSMSTAAVGVATFAAVMVFDAVDSPTVNFTTTSADAQATRVPTASVVTDEVEVQSQEAVEAASQSTPTSQSANEPDTVVALAQEAEEEEERATVAAVTSEQEAEQEEAAEVAEQEQAEQQAEAAEEEQAQEQYEAQEATTDSSTADPSRRALTAGQRSGTGQAKSVNVEGVVAQQEQAEEAAESKSVDQGSEQAAEEQAASAAAEEGQAEESTTVELPERESSDDEQSAAVETETRSVATSVARGESDWPLEQRPRSSTVRLARDPSWELPVQIVLAAVAVSSAVFWLVLTIVDRRRRA